jgi:hypothetical protein
MMYALAFAGKAFSSSVECVEFRGVFGRSVIDPFVGSQNLQRKDPSQMTISLSQKKRHSITAY